MSGISEAQEKAFSFTQRRIEKLPRPASSRAEYRDKNTPGLILRVTPRGKKTFYLFRRLDGQLKRLALGVFPETSVSAARDRVGKLQTDHHSGVDIVADRRKRRECPTLKEAFSHYLERHAKQRKRTWAEDEAQYNRYLKSRWAGRRLTTIRKADVARLHSKLGQEHGIYAANRLRSLLAKIFTVAMEDELYNGPNPVLGVKKFREQSRDRFLDAAELKRFFGALSEEPNEVIRDYLKLSVLVGARRSNMLGMRWDQIDRAKGIWRIPETKSGEPQIVPLSVAAGEVIEERWNARKDGCPWVFPTTGNHPSKSGHLQDPTKIWKAVLARAELEDVRLHDLRRTLASWQAMLGTSELIIGKTLGHAAGSTATRVYARLQTDPVRESVEKATLAMQKAAGLLEDETKPKRKPRKRRKAKAGEKDQ